MTTPDKEEMPTEDRTVVKFRSTDRGMAGHYISDDTGRLIAVAQSAARAAQIVTACNAYEPTREALLALRDAIASLDKPVLGYETAGHRSAYWPVQSVLLNQIDAALSTLPVNDRQTSDDVWRLRDRLRELGYAVAVHNDYRINGVAHTFWLFTHPDGRWIKGEGETDAIALRAALNSTDRQTSDDVGRLREAARRAHDTLIEINPSNYTHDDVCALNAASVEAILLLADAIGERHGKTEQWWSDRRAALKGVTQPASSPEATTTDRICPGCKTEVATWPYPYMRTLQGECWHMYCYHSTADTSWSKTDGNGNPRHMTEAEAAEHRAWAARTYENPLKDQPASEAGKPSTDEVRG